MFTWWYWQICLVLQIDQTQDARRRGCFFIRHRLTMMLTKVMMAVKDHGCAYVDALLRKNSSSVPHWKMLLQTIIVEKKTNEHRTLHMRKQKPVPIKLLNPKFEENFVSTRDYDPDRQWAKER
nr:nucleolar protein 14 [Tanacetum cinerariifolium]